MHDGNADCDDDDISKRIRTKDLLSIIWKVLIEGLCLMFKCRIGSITQGVKIWRGGCGKGIMRMGIFRDDDLDFYVKI